MPVSPVAVPVWRGDSAGVAAYITELGLHFMSTHGSFTLVF